jgi:hypothetical protein
MRMWLQGVIIYMQGDWKQEIGRKARKQNKEKKKNSKAEKWAY